MNGKLISREEIPFQFLFPAKRGQWETADLKNGQQIQWWAGFSKETIPDEEQRGFVVYREGLGDRLPDLTVDDLNEHTVSAYTADEDRPIKYWSVYRSLVGSLALDGGRYALNEGSWYRIDNAYKDAADQKFSDLCGKPDNKLRPFKKIIKRKRKERSKR